jgi:hypothetical protein
MDRDTLVGLLDNHYLDTCVSSVQSAISVQSVESEKSFEHLQKPFFISPVNPYLHVHFH